MPAYTLPQLSGALEKLSHRSSALFVGALEFTTALLFLSPRCCPHVMSGSSGSGLPGVPRLTWSVTVPLICPSVSSVISYGNRSLPALSIKHDVFSNAGSTADITLSSFGFPASSITFTLTTLTPSSAIPLIVSFPTSFLT